MPESLISTLADVLAADETVLGVWLAGSRGRGDDDQYSDVDLWVVSTDVDAFLATWPERCASAVEVVLTKRVGFAPVFAHVTPQWLRFDISVSDPSSVPGRGSAGLKPLLDRADLHAQLSGDAPDLMPDPRRVAELTGEFIRVLGLLPMILHRGDYVLAASGSNLLRQYLIQLMTEDIAVPDRGGAGRRYALLPRQVLENLPPIAATRESALAVHLACASAFEPLARRLCGPSFPEALWTAMTAHLTREGIPLA
ncbi:nucleotidyltransferase domain-containing protein [Longispora albida]|uniref:nucleotidyltransferase domain-containing protein n=1 Tax=Longispora albida TaxID=203523 RepID=UPI00037B64EF|nr:nucleotidyltransferase domain-containing protein [Longispora albida]